MQFTYTAKDVSGCETSGSIEAESKLEAADKLFNDAHLTVTSLTRPDETSATPAPIAKPSVAPTMTMADNATRVHIGSAERIVKPATPARDTTKDIRSFGDILTQINELTITITSVTTKDKVIFFRLLASMINAGMPIVKSLRNLVEHTQNLRFKRVVASVAEMVERGSSFSKALGEYADVFTDGEIGIIATGETSGQLNAALTELAVQTEKHATLVGKIRSALIYPAVVMMILIGAATLVMVKVIPSMSELFASTGSELPTLTRTLIAISDWFVDSTLGLPHWLLVIAVFPATIAIISAMRRTPEGQMFWDRVFLRTPIVGDLIKKVTLATFARQLSMLTGAGVSILRTLDISARALGNAVYKQRILDVREAVERGVPIHKAIEGDTELFPSVVVSMIAVGEETAHLGETTKKIAEYYDEEVDRFVGNLSTIIEPIVIVLVGVLVGVLVAAIMQPIMSIADIASQQ